MSPLDAAEENGGQPVSAGPGLQGWAALPVVSLVYCAVLVYIVSPFLFHDQSLFVADVTYNFAPAGRYINQVFTAAHGFTLMEPLWNPYLLCGAPQVSVAWPLAYVPGYAACFLDAARGQAFLIFFHLLVAGIGGYVWFARYDERQEQTGSHVEALLAAITSPSALFGFMFMLCGYMLGSSINLSLLFSVCWTPFALATIDWLARAAKRNFPATGFLALVLAQQFGAGRPEMFLGECVLYACYALLKIAELAPDQRGRNAAGRFMLELVAALALALAYNAANILPMIEAVKSSPHLPKFDPSDALNWSAGWFEFLEILFMQPLGELNMAHYSLYPTYPNSMAYVTSLFLGAPVVVLAFIGTGDTSWKQRGFWLWMIALFTIASLGEFIPIWKPIYEAIPSINLLRFPVKMTIFLELAIIALAARGWHAALKGTVSRHDFTGAMVLWGLLLVLGGAIFASTVTGNMQSLGVVMSMSSGCDDLKMAKEAALKLTANAAIAGFTGFAASLALANLRGRFELLIRFSLVLLIVSSLVINGTLNLWHTVDASFFNDKARVLSLVEKSDETGSNNTNQAYWNPVAAPRDYKVLSLFRHPIAVPEKVLEAPEAQTDREFMRYARYILAPNTNIDRGIAMLSGMPVLPDWATVFMETGILPRSSARAELTHEAGKSDVPLYKWCQATATKYILCPIDTQSEEDLKVRSSKLLEPHYFKVAAEDKRENVRIYEVSPIRKRVQLFCRAKKMETRTEALKQINRSDTLPYDPLTECILNVPEKSSIVSFEGKLPELNVALLDKIVHGEIVNHPGTAEITADSRESVLVEVEAKVPCALVFTDAYYSGWTATDNGSPTRILICDGLMKAVLLEPGKHKVAFRYVPFSYMFGLLFSVDALGIIVAMICFPFFFDFLKRRRRHAIIQS